jgi:hypothetical protein
MHIYMIDIWGPCENAEEVQQLRKGAPSDEAIVFAPTKDIANQLCYLVSTREKQFKPNYQEIDTFVYPISCILQTNLMPVTFSDDIVRTLLKEPMMAPLKVPDTQKEPGVLFFAQITDETDDVEKKLKAEFWVYDRDEQAARDPAARYGESCGLFDLGRESIRIELVPMKRSCVFWNVKKETNKST